MNLNNLVFVVAQCSYYILVCVSHLRVDANGGDTPAAATDYLSDVAINCGTLGNSTALDGRHWTGETASKFLSPLQPKGKSRSSTVVHKFKSADSVPYMTARISATPFHYTFRVNPGQKFIRLHFYPASYRGFEKSLDFFTVKAGPFTLLKDFSASVDADACAAKYLVKEFCLNVDENVELKIIFSPFQGGNNIYAFVNGIEIISMPSGLYYTPPGDLGAPVVGLNNQLYIIDKSTALEAIQRLNIGGSSISSVEDFGMFRRWNEDTSYLLESKAHRVNHLVLKLKYVPAYIAPPKLYQTSWKTGRNVGVSQVYSFAWKIPIDLGFAYLIRLHFCELDMGTTESGQREFSIVINNEIAETRANVIRWSGGTGMPVYKDYAVIMKADKEGGQYDLLIALQSEDKLVLGLLNGLEIFKLSNLENSFTTPNPFTKIVSTSWNLKNQKVFLGFGQSNVVATGMTILIILVNIVVYNLRQIWEYKFDLETGTGTSRIEQFYYRFSLVEIKSATQNFSDALVIGRGGFGKVYKGFITSISEIVAIKRLNFSSRQGAHEFWTEIETLSRLRHVHLVSLLGYCNEGQEMILVYEYMACGTLADHLYKLSRKGKDIAPLSWQQRLRICIGAARGLEYLHTGTECPVIHRDVKDSNILLDESFVAKISDFGLSKLEKRTQSKSYVSTLVKGTHGYLDPEYVMTHRLTRKSDVYAFGVVLLVVLSGRPVIDTKFQEQQSLLSCFRECITEGNVDRIVDPHLQGKISSKSLTEFLKSVENCLHHLPKKRPTMAQAVASLEQALEQQESPVVSSSINSTVNGQEDVPILAEIVISSPEEGIIGNPIQNPYIPASGNDLPVLENCMPSPKEGTSNLAQNPYSTTRVNDLQPRRKDYARVPKPSWNWPRKAIWSRGKKQKAEVSLLELMPEGVQLYSYKTLADATNGFQPENEIGIGFFNAVYKGILSTGQAIAVKVRSSNHYQRSVEFMNEVVVLSKLQHPNIVRLLGCCVEKDLRMLIYGYMPNKSLDSYLFDTEKRYVLDWNRRAIIIAGIGRGLLYLHRDSRLNIIHKNLKASNILLDEELKPKISDCELARTLGSKYESDTIRDVRIWGYHTAPDCATEGRFSDKSDVYSYGLLLLEIVSGKTNSSFYGRSLIRWAWKLWNGNKTMELVDSALLFPPNETEISRYVQVGLLCVQDSSKDRPNMSTVLSMLSGEIEELPQPNLSSCLSETECSPP